MGANSIGGWTGQKEHGGRPFRIWGSKLTENVSQAMARDVLGMGILALEKAGFPVLLHFHDEALVEVDEDNAIDAAKEVEHIFTTPPEWALDLTLASSVEITDRYKK